MRIIIILCIAFLHVSVTGQTPFFQENFNNGCATGCLGSAYNGTNGAWTVTSTGTNGANANQWFVSCAEDGFLANPTCANGCSGGGGDATAHIGNISTSTLAPIVCPGGDCRAIYDDTTPAEATDLRFESPVIDCSAYDTISLEFMYILGGVSCTNDYLALDYFDGTNWTTIDPCVTSTTNTCPAPYIGNWRINYSITLPASADSNANVRIGFRWVNNGNGNGTDPSVAIDNIVLSGDSVAPSLAIPFSKFIVLPGNQEVRLNWAPGDHHNLHVFQVERSEDGRTFQMLDEVLVNESYTSYAWTDARPLDGINYYRIRQIDKSGNSGYSEIRSVNFGIDKTFALNFPTLYNLGQTPLAEIYTSEHRNVMVRVTDMSGKIVFSQPDLMLSRGYNDVRIEQMGQSSGWYLLEVIPVSGGMDAFPLRSRFIIR